MANGALILDPHAVSCSRATIPKILMIGALSAESLVECLFCDGGPEVRRILRLTLYVVLDTVDKCLPAHHMT
jgi:hypothetical protein